MDFLKRQFFFIICGVVAVAGLALAGLGLQGMPAVQTQLGEAESMYNELSSLQSASANAKYIEREKKRIEQVEAERKAVYERAREMYGWKPLMPDMFPTVKEARKTLDFAREYRNEMDALVKLMRAGPGADEVQISDMARAIKEEEAQARNLQQDPGSSATPAPITGPAFDKGGVLTKAGVQQDPVARAQVYNAQGLYMYAQPYVAQPANAPTKIDPSFDYNDYLLGKIDPNRGVAPFDLWWAQLGLWIQTDVAKALLAVNEEAREQLPDNQDPWVATLPVKELISFRMRQKYVDDALVAAPPSVEKAGPALPTSSSAMVFTGTSNNDVYDVTHFSLKLVMDQRAIPRLVEKLCVGKPYTLLRISYMQHPVDRSMRDKVYGDQPVVQVLMDFEVVMLGEVLRPLMPDVILEEYAIPMPEGREPTEG